MSVTRELNRRRFLAYFSAAGLSSTLLPGVLWARIQNEEAPKITKGLLKDAEEVAGVEFTDEERDLMLEGLNEQLGSYETLRTVKIANGVPPALVFSPLLSGMSVEGERRPIRMSDVRVNAVPADLEEVAVWPVTELSQLIQSRRISSVALTKMYLSRLKRYGPKLECTITLTEELALEQARRADEEIAAGRYRGPLHGIPWGAKDLLAVKGYKTTWGAMPYQDQIIDEDATVVDRLREAGAVLVAKLTLGALAWGDVWYGGKTRNPWDYEQGSSGSSAGSASATAAGLVGFSIGTETWGSIVSPSTRCGTTGLRPTFGRVSRHGAMALSWSMDKIGPICRSVEDCAIVFDAIYGPDGKDLSVLDAPFNWDAGLDIKGLRVGYLKGAFEEDRGEEEEEEEDKKKAQEWKAIDERTLERMRAMGVGLVPIELPDLPIGSLSFILSAEAGAAFDELTRSDRLDLMVRQVKDAWPNVFRQSRLIPAVEYIQANRVRTMVMHAMAEVMSDIDVYLAPSFVGDNLLLTNLTGHPCVVLPNGFRQDGTPTSITFMGKLFGEAETLAVARAYQEATGFHLRHPTLAT
jgi:Asp-tRNA(Asn)/Glu-tRNA(Gln) amidotransferase A subunit family amidase